MKSQSKVALRNKMFNEKAMQEHPILSLPLPFSATISHFCSLFSLNNNECCDVCNSHSFFALAHQYQAATGNNYAQP